MLILCIILMYTFILRLIKKVNHVIPAHGEATMKWAGYTQNVQRKQSQTNPDIELEGCS